MMRLTSCLLSGLLFAAAACAAAPALPPDEEAAALMRNIQRAIPEVPLTLDAEIRMMDRRGKPTGTIRANAFMNPRGGGEEREIRYTLLDPAETMAVDMAAATPAFSFFSGDSPDAPAAPLPDLYAPIRGSELCWMELSFAFFWWPEPRIIGMENVPGRGDCLVVEIPCPPDVQSSSPEGWTRILLWVMPEYSAVVRGEAWRGATALKRFDVLSIRKLRRIYMIGEMEVRNLQTQARSRLKITKMNMSSPEYTEEELDMFNAPVAW